MTAPKEKEKTTGRVKILDPSIGSDPEVFIYASGTDEIVSAIGLVGGSKWKPRPLDGAPGFFVQEDNVLAEFNIPPAYTKNHFVEYIHKGLSLLEKELPPGHKPKIQASYTFPDEQLTDPLAQEFGCNPDYDAWTGEANVMPERESVLNLRSAGGHVVVGYKGNTETTNVALIRMLDAYLGVPSVILDSDTARRKLYGKAGAFRHKRYGVEYRTLSSFWLASKELTGWVYDQTLKAIEQLNNNKTDVIDEYPAVIVNTINTGDVEAAKMFIEQYGIKLPNV